MLAQRINWQQALGMLHANQMLGVKCGVTGSTVAFDGQHVGTHRMLMHPDAEPVELIPEFDFPPERCFEALEVACGHEPKGGQNLPPEPDAPCLEQVTPIAGTAPHFALHRWCSQVVLQGIRASSSKV